MEKCNGYIIDEKDVAGMSGFSIFTSKTKIELEAKVVPDAEIIYGYLKSRNIVKRTWDSILYDLRYNSTSNWSQQERTIVSALSEFISENTRYYKESANVLLDFSMTGYQPRTYQRALDKIKEKVQRLPNPKVAFIEFLGSRGLTIH